MPSLYATQISKNNPLVLCVAKSEAPNVQKDIAIEATIKGLRIRAFVAHLAWEKPSILEELYREFEKYCRSDNDLRRRLEEQNQNKQYQGSGRNAKRGNKSQGHSLSKHLINKFST